MHRLESKTVFTDVIYVENHKDSTKKLLSDFYQAYGV